MDIFGIDLSGPTNTSDTALIHLRARGDQPPEVRRTVAGTTDRDMYDLADTIDGDLLVALDAPLSYEPGGGRRDVDAALQNELESRGHARSYVMPPTMTRMIYLTARGMTVARLLQEAADARVVETHPIAALLFRGIPESDASSLKESPEARRRTVERLRAQHLPDLPTAIQSSDHAICAVGAALAALGHTRGTPEWHRSSDLPHHPFALVC